MNADYTIIEDFDLACEFGYGQFIWNSANYLKDTNIDNNDKDLKETDVIQQVDVSINSVPMNTDIPERL